MDKPSFSMNTALMKIQKAQELTEQSMDKITDTVSDLTCLLAEIQHRYGINEDNVKELDAEIEKQEKKLDERA